MTWDPRDPQRQPGDGRRPDSGRRRFTSLELWQQIVAGIVAGLVVAGVVAIIGHVVHGSGRAGASASSGSSSPTPLISTSDLNNSFTALAGLKSLASSGKGSIAVILPDTISSARYAEFDAPYLGHAFTTAGLPGSDFTIQNAQGSQATQLSDARFDIASGASVLARSGMAEATSRGDPRR